MLRQISTHYVDCEDDINQTIWTLENQRDSVLYFTIKMMKGYIRCYMGLALILIGAPVVVCQRIRKDNDPSSRTFTVRNLSTSNVEVYWMNLATEDRVLQFELVPGASDRLNSHVVHEFEIREKVNNDGVCSGKLLVIDTITSLEPTTCFNRRRSHSSSPIYSREKRQMPEKILSNNGRRRSRYVKSVTKLQTISNTCMRFQTKILYFLYTVAL